MFVFSTYLPVFLLKFRLGELIGCGIKQRHSAYFWRPHYPKKEIPEKTWWWHHHNVFSNISCFRGSGVHKKYAVWVLVGCGIKFRIQRALPLKIWVKTQRDMSKIRTKKVVFFYDKYVNSTIMVDSLSWNSIGSWIPTHNNLLSAHFLIRPILDPKFPLIFIVCAQKSKLFINIFNSRLLTLH